MSCRSGTIRYAPLFVLLASMLVVSGCSGGSEGWGSEGQGSESSDLAAMSAPAEGESVAALEGVEAANKTATGWQDDARLYAIAAATPRLDAGGESPSWLYTYVSESAGAVASVTYSEAEGARLDPAQQLPEADISYITENVLPDTSQLTNSTEAIDRTDEVLATLEEDPDISASAGLDSAPGGEPQWIFATTQGEERVEERV
ncbi:MAG: hypothetical protein ACR2KW_03740, partial [Rubrobacter sp.]